LGAFSSHAPILPYLPKDDKNYIPIIIAIWYYTDENLLGTWSAFDKLPDYTAEPSQGASQIFVVGGQSETQAGTSGLRV
jgi:hypothetical protein